MALIPRLFRPSVIIRRKAMYDGFLGNSTLWKLVGVVVFGKSTLKKFFGRNAEVLDVSSLGAGRTMQIATARPLTRRRRRQALRRGETVPTLAGETARARRWAERHAAAKAS